MVHRRNVILSSCFGIVAFLTNEILGAIGLVAMKNLLEEGFDVTGFDRNQFLGGLWHYDEQARISVLQSIILSEFTKIHANTLNRYCIERLKTESTFK